MLFIFKAILKMLNRALARFDIGHNQKYAQLHITFNMSYPDFGWGRIFEKLKGSLENCTHHTKQRCN